MMSFSLFLDASLLHFSPFSRRNYSRNRYYILAMYTSIFGSRRNSGRLPHIDGMNITVNVAVLFVS